MPKIFSIWLGKIVITLLRLTGSSGSALPGLIVERVDRNFIAKMLGNLKHGAVLVTGTNGKTTTTKFIKEIVAKAGIHVVTNPAGSNMSRGIASAIIENASWLGNLSADLALFEVDEAFIRDVADKVRPQVIVVLNLLRDQLDRYGELDRTARLIASSFQYSRHIVLNADDELVASLQTYANTNTLSYFGVTPRLKQQLPDDARLLGKTHTLNKSGTTSPNEPTVLLVDAKAAPTKQVIALRYKGKTYRTTLLLPGIYNAANAAAALCVTSELQIPFDSAIENLAVITPPFGRSERISIAGKTIELLLVKNPAGFNQVINTFLQGGTGLPILMALNDNFADGRDVSWIWDVDFEKMQSYKHAILVSGIRGNDLALRLKYAELHCSIEPKLAEALKNFLRGLKADQIGYIIPSYTALLELRKLIGRQVKLAEMWR